jgi:hypothetical protein
MIERGYAEAMMKGRPLFRLGAPVPKTVFQESKMYNASKGASMG